MYSAFETLPFSLTHTRISTCTGPRIPWLAPGETLGRTRLRTVPSALTARAAFGAGASSFFSGAARTEAGFFLSGVNAGGAGAFCVGEEEEEV